MPVVCVVKKRAVTSEGSSQKGVAASSCRYRGVVVGSGTAEGEAAVEGVGAVSRTFYFAFCRPATLGFCRGYRDINAVTVCATTMIGGGKFAAMYSSGPTGTQCSAMYSKPAGTQCMQWCYILRFKMPSVASFC